MIKLDYAALKYPPSRKAIKAMKKTVSTINEYPDETYLKIKKALVKKHGFCVNNYLVGNGLDEVIDIITKTFVNENDEVIIPTPTFSQFEIAAKRAKGTVKEVNVLEDNTYLITSQKIVKNITDNTKLIWICSPNNPTGTITSEETIKDILSKTNAIVVVDEALGDMAKSNKKLIEENPNLIILKTFSKAYGLAGIRIGFMMAQANLITKVSEQKQIFNVNKIAVSGAIAALEDIKYYKKLWREFNEEKSKQIKKLEKLGITIVGKESNFLLIDFKTEEKSKYVYEMLLKNNIKIFPGWDEEFTGLPARFCRVVISTPKENKVFYEKIKKILTK